MFQLGLLVALSSLSSRANQRWLEENTAKTELESEEEWSKRWWEPTQIRDCRMPSTKSGRPGKMKTSKHWERFQKMLGRFKSRLNLVVPWSGRPLLARISAAIGKHDRGGAIGLPNATRGVICIGRLHFELCNLNRLCRQGSETFWYGLLQVP